LSCHYSTCVALDPAIISFIASNEHFTSARLGFVSAWGVFIWFMYTVAWLPVLYADFVTIIFWRR
jgi:hypothetical protein